MNSRQTKKIRQDIQDVILALLIFMFFILATMSSTVGNTSFYNGFSKKLAVTTIIQEELKQKTDAIAEKTGLEPMAFDFAVGSNKISTAQTEMIKGAFGGQNYDYSDSRNIKNCYIEGITEYYRMYDIELDKNALEEAVPLACEAFNSTLGIENCNEFSRFSKYIGRYSIYGAVLVFALAIFMVLRIYATSYGRTKVWSHYACAMNSAGLALVLLFIANLFIRFSDTMHLSSNKALNYILASGADRFFLIEAAFGVALIIGGSLLLGYVYRYYNKKAAKNRLEADINRTLLVEQEGEDKTIAQIVEERRNLRNKESD